jgi:hypothetical protein
MLTKEWKLMSKTDKLPYILLQQEDQLRYYEELEKERNEKGNLPRIGAIKLKKKKLAPEFNLNTIVKKISFD